MRLSIALILTGLAVGIAGRCGAAEAAHQKLLPVPFSEVKFTDDFWAPRIQTNREVTVPHNLKWCEQTGRISNFAKAAGLMPGKFEGIFFNDSDLYKVLEGASYCLASHADPALDKKLDEIIALIAAAQQKDGYLNSYYTLVEPDRRWTDLPAKHELYCAGHLIEAAVAHNRATGKKTLLDVACRYADYIDTVFGPPPKRNGVPGHEELELALVKLYHLTGNEKYFALARFFIDRRGVAEGRMYWDDRAKKLVRQDRTYGDYCQDHLPFVRQSEPIGHAVRAMYFYSGAADVAAVTGEKGYVDALDRLFTNTVLRKMYITGAIGSTSNGEAFGKNYDLPNDTAYCETCASVGMGLWNHRLNLLHGDAKYADVAERVIYNGFLAGVSLSGDRFFYVNPLASKGNHHRQPFFGCACCPTNVVRFLPSLPGYVYATSGRDVFVNLYVAGTGKIALGGDVLNLVQETRYPWEGAVKITVNPAKAETFAINVRIPGWARGMPVPGDLYRFADEAAGSSAGAVTLKVNGQAVDLGALPNGYARIERAWQGGDVIELDLPMAIHRVVAHPQVQADVGRVALQRGAIVYCLEAADNGGHISQYSLPPQAKLSAQFRKDLLGGVEVLTAQAAVRQADGQTQTAPVVAIPYYAWDQREPGEMAVWFPEKPELARAVPKPTPAGMAKVSASYCHSADATSAVNDQIEPANSNDHDIPRFTWWDHRGTKEWVQYDFASPRKVASVEVYWFDDTRRPGSCRVPQSWTLLYKDGNDWKSVRAAGEPGTRVDRYNKVTFEPVQTTALRIEVQLQPDFSGGILEWKVGQ